MIMAGNGGPHRFRRRTILGAAALAPVAAGARWSASAAVDDPGVSGQWSAPFDMGGVAIHATLLRNDDVLFF